MVVKKSASKKCEMTDQESRILAAAVAGAVACFGPKDAARTAKAALDITYAVMDGWKAKG